MNKQSQRSKAESGILAQSDIPPNNELIKLVVGPFARNEEPKIQTRFDNEEPAGSLVCNEARLDGTDGYRLVYVIQNYGIRTVLVTISRIG